jgi:hypothetical protein
VTAARTTGRPERQSPGLAGIDLGRNRRHVELEVAADDDIAPAGRTEPRRISLALREDQCDALRGRSHQGLEALATALAALAEARIREDHRHVERIRGSEQVRPDLGLHQHADRRPEVHEEPAHRRRRVVRQPGLPVALAQQRASGFATGRGAVGQQQPQVGPALPHGLDQRGRRARLAERHAWTQNQPAEGAPPVATEALADRLAVKRLGPAAPPEACDIGRRDHAQQRRISQARRAARVRVQRPLPRVDSSRLRPAPA